MTVISSAGVLDSRVLPRGERPDVPYAARWAPRLQQEARIEPRKGNDGRDQGFERFARPLRQESNTCNYLL